LFDRSGTRTGILIGTDALRVVEVVDALRVEHGGAR
jgi:hypothetical protein